MTGEVDLARIDALLADRTRETILLTLLNGGPTPASALAERAEVSRSLASAHLRKLEVGGLIRVEPRVPGLERAPASPRRCAQRGVVRRGWVETREAS